MTKRRPSPSEADYWHNPDIYVKDNKFYKISIGGTIRRIRRPKGEQDEDN